MDAPSLPGIKAVFCDLDGTLYLGDQLIPGAIAFLERCRAREIRTFFLTNNSSRSVDQYLDKLNGLGIPAAFDEVLLSTHDLLVWLSEKGIHESFSGGHGRHAVDADRRGIYHRFTNTRVRRVGL